MIKVIAVLVKHELVAMEATIEYYVPDGTFDSAAEKLVQELFEYGELNGEDWVHKGYPPAELQSVIITGMSPCQKDNTDGSN